MFRAFWEGGHRTYSHFADIASLDRLKNMITDDDTKPGISQEFFDQVKTDYLIPANLKKLDIGGGLIHGHAEDFREDASDKIIMAHQALKLTLKQKEIGASAPFGMVDTLIPSNNDYTIRHAKNLLRNYFPNAQNEELRMLLNCDVASFNAGGILLKKGNPAPYIYLILTGMAEMIQAETENHHMLSAGSMVGEQCCLEETVSKETYSALSYIKALKISASLYNKFVRRNGLLHNINQIIGTRYFLQNTWLFGELVSYPILNKIAREIKIKQYSKDESLDTSEKPGLFLLEKGEIQTYINGRAVETIGPGSFIGEETILYDTLSMFKTKSNKNSTIFWIPGKILVT